MEDPLRRFHTFKDVFLLRRTGQEAKATAYALRTELMKKRKGDMAANAETWTPSKKRRRMNAWRHYISHGIDVSKELYAYFNFPKIDLMSVWVEQFRRYAALQQYSAERLKHTQWTNPNDGLNTSIHYLNHRRQVITFQHRIRFLEIGELNLQALT